jgi:hypothetical protein
MLRDNAWMQETAWAGNRFQVHLGKACLSTALRSVLHFQKVKDDGCVCYLPRCPQIAILYTALRAKAWFFNPAL